MTCHFTFRGWGFRARGFGALGLNSELPVAWKPEKGIPGLQLRWTLDTLLAQDGHLLRSAPLMLPKYGSCAGLSTHASKQKACEAPGLKLHAQEHVATQVRAGLLR